MIGYDSVNSCFIVIVICIMTVSGLDGACCNFEQVDTGCSEVFQVEEIDEHLPCILKTEFPSSDGVCEMSEHNQEAGFQDGGHSSNQIQLLATDFNWDAICQRGINFEENCIPHQTESTFITLDISFNLTGADVHGIHFDLRTVEGEVEPSVGSLKKSCHYLHFNSSLPDDILSDRLFTYSGFVGLHPGSRYRLKATTITTNGTHTDFTQKEFRVPDCRDMPKNNSDFFCNLPTPANWPSRILVTPNTFHVTFSVWPEEDVFDLYLLYLLNGPSLEDSNDIIAKEKVKYTENNIEYQDMDGVNTTVMRHTFEGAHEMPPGMYSIAVLPHPDDACTADYHWGKRRCLYTLFPFTHGKSTASSKPLLPSLLPSSERALTGTRGATSYTSTNKGSYSTVTPASPQQFRIIFILLLVFLIICLVCICLWCCSLEICNGNSIFSSLHYFVCGRNTIGDDITVTTFNRMNQYEPVPLQTIPATLHCQHSSTGSSTDGIASCSDAQSSL